MEIKYYKLLESTDSAEIGHWPQLSIPKNYFEIKNNFKILDYFSFPNTNPNFDNYILHTNSKITSLLSCDMVTSSKGFFVNENFKKLLSGFKLEGARFYDANIFQNEKNIGVYFFMNVIYDFFNLIDLKKSVFFDVINEKNISIEYSDLKDISPLIQPKKIFLTEKVDLMRSPFNVEIIVSEKLMSKLKEEKKSGYKFEEFDQYQIISN